MTAIRHAAAELTALAMAVRPDWPEHHVSGAISAAAVAGMTWEQVLVSLPRLMADPKASPRDLVPDSRSPLARTNPDPSVAQAGAAAARRALAAVRDGAA